MFSKAGLKNGCAPFAAVPNSELINRLLPNQDNVRFYKRPKVTIDEIVKDAVADFRKNKDVLRYALRLDKISEFCNKKDAIENKTEKSSQIGRAHV